MLIRKIHHNEIGLYADHLKRLDPSDRRSRFAEEAVTDETIEHYVSQIPEDDLLMGAFDTDDVLVAAVHVGLGGHIAEVGVSVEPAQRGKGLGTELMEHAILWSRNRHADKLYTIYADGNKSMQALAKHMGMTITHDHGTAEGTMALDPPDVITIGDEIASDVHEVLHDWSHALAHVQDLWFYRLGTSPEAA